MLDEEPQIGPREFVREVTASENIASMMDERQLVEIGQKVMADYKLDKASMQDWFERMERGLDLARLVKAQKDYPFKNAANIKYPLVTSAALQFNARAYPAIVAPDRIVKAKVWGDDPQGQKADRAERVSEHMSWQLSAQISEWEEETDKLLTQLSIVGTMIRKWWYDPVERRPRCRTIEPGKFIVNDKVKVLDAAPRCTEELSLYPFEIDERKRAGTFVESFELNSAKQDDQATEEFIEQHTRIDLDQDGYPEPYIVTVHIDQQQVVRIVADYDEEDVIFEQERRTVPVMSTMADPVTGAAVPMMQMQQQDVIVGIASIKRGSYFIAHQFLPALDGGFWGTGLGLLLGDISDSINTIINMMLDSGHYASLGGGFIGSEFRIKGGAQRMRPGEWRNVAATGDDIRKAMMPMQFSGPDATLFQLLGMLIDAGREIASVKDVITGEAPRQQQTATGTLALIEQGMMVFTAAYKRIFRACKDEYAMLARINRQTVSPEMYERFHDGQFDPQADYTAADMDIQPIADPRSVTKMQQVAKAETLMGWAQQGLVDPQEATMRAAEALDIPDREQLMPKRNLVAEQMQQLQMQMDQADLASKMADIELKLAKVEESRAQAIENIAGAQNDTARAANEMTKTRMEAVRVILEDERQRMADLLRGSGRMEIPPGNQVNEELGGQAVGGAQVSTPSPLVV